ncbi:MAG TPA: RNA polymerase sigma factor [Candidatus Eisenbacteria bacterium]|nr:RNA polymerase sigma factor [Candidatus Eisenbacteria bacterium]
MSPESPAPDLLLTVDLLRDAKQGDAAALDALMARYLPRLHRWACGRLPAHARSLFETSDLVQETLLKALQMLDQIEIGGPGSFQAYVRRAIQNRIVDEVRWATRRAGSEPISEAMADPHASPLDKLIGRDLLQRYEHACSQLSADDRLLLHLRLELEFGYEDIAAAMNRPSPDAARMGVKRALKKLAEVMGHER